MKSTGCFTVVLLLLTLFINGCDNKTKHEKLIGELLKVDREFAMQSVNQGSQNAFLAYIDDSCVLLRPHRLPIVGREKIKEMFSTPDTSFTLNWEPLFADVSGSGDLGYTYGIYNIEMDSPEGDKVSKNGTYVTIWKKNKEGKWKFVLDTGNHDLGPTNGESEKK